MITVQYAVLISTCICFAQQTATIGLILALRHLYLSTQWTIKNVTFYFWL